MFILIPFIARVLLESFILVSFNLKGNLKGSETDFKPHFSFVMLKYFRTNQYEEL